LLREMPRIENVDFAKVQCERWATEIANRDCVGRVIDAILQPTELIDLAQQWDHFSGEATEVYYKNAYRIETV